MKQPVSQSIVLAWLAEHQPQLESVIERDWIWIVTPLAGDQNKPAREAIKTMLNGNGFRFAKKGHSLPDGRIAYWAHSCSHPLGFHRKKETKRDEQGVLHTKTAWEQIHAEVSAALELQTS